VDRSFVLSGGSAGTRRALCRNDLARIDRIGMAVRQLTARDGVTTSTAKKIWYLLTPRQRRTAVVMVGQMLLGVVLETLSVGLVIPAFAAMAPGGLAADFPGVAAELHGLANISSVRLVMLGASVVVGIFALKALYLAYLAHRQMRFAFGLKADLSERLYAGYLRQPYPFFLGRNSAQLINNTVYQVSELTNAVQQGLILATELLNLLAISVLLLLVEPLGTLLVMGVLGLAGWSFNQVTRDRILRWGQARLAHEERRLKQLQQGLGGVKEVKLLGREEAFLGLYRPSNDGAARANERQQTLQQLPRLWLELLAVIGLAVLVAVMMAQGKPLVAVIPTLGLFAAAAFRLTPSANRIVGAVQAVRYALPVIDTLHAELLHMKPAPVGTGNGPIPLRTVLSLDHVSFRYAEAEAEAVVDVSLTIPRGTTVGFVGW
jgi:ABC-type multidrug transport system fused ATPase/permease subunit